ncbi:MAG: insulinase family protein [candidate division SR1 bacterium]|nr:insulinase family protein [candidate division SR1 bacterium]
MKYEIKILSGITCIFAPMQESNSITIQIGVKAGSIYETTEEAGISHFLEHMFFKGGKKWTTPKAVATAMDKIGAEFNASTGKHSTSYYVKSAPHFATEGLELLADMMVDAQFPEAELEREKGVVIQELKMYEDQPIHVCDEKWQRFFFGEGNYGRPIIGYEATINGFNAQALFDYKKALYTKDNLVITIAGKILDQEQLESMITELFSPLSEKKEGEKPEFSRNLPLEKSDFFKKGTEQNHLIISMPGLNGLEEKKYAASVLCTILGGNMSSRLFQNIREKLGLCYYIRGNHAQTKEFGIFSIRAGLDKEKFNFGVEKIHEEINTFLEKRFSDEEFENAKNYLIGGIQMGIESSDEMADFLEHQYLTYGEIKTLDQFLAKYQQVTRDDVESLFPYLYRDKRWSYHIE